MSGKVAISNNKNITIIFFSAALKSKNQFSSSFTSVLFHLFMSKLVSLLLPPSVVEY